MDKHRDHLKNDTILKNGKTPYQISSYLNSGSSSLVYQGTQLDNKVPIIIKEIYPYEEQGCISRNDNQIIIKEGIAGNKQNTYLDFFELHKIKALQEKEIREELARNFYPYSDMFLDCFCENNTIYTVFHNKDNSSDLSKETSFDLEKALSYTLRILEALEPLHELGYLHLDISPDNIYKTMMDKDNPILIFIDLNSAVKIDNIEDVKLTSKIGFSAYELENNKKDKISYATDLYSVVACLFYWINNNIPTKFDGISNNPITNKEIIDNSSNEVITQCNKLFKKGLHADSTQRYTTIVDLKKDINVIVAMLKAYKGANEKATTTIEKKNPNNIKFIVAGLMVLFIIAFFVIKNYTTTTKLAESLSATPSQTISAEPLLETTYIEYEDGSIYEGEINTLTGEKEGYGELSFPDGTFYKGEWEKDLEHGEGVFIAFYGEYTGEFHYGEFSGYGEMVYSDGDVYKGYWENTAFNGQGTLTYSNGDYLKGNFKNGYLDGNGTSHVLLDSGITSTFEGEFSNMGRDIEGKQTYSDGLIYSGKFTNFVLNGTGTQGYINGATLYGEFVNGKLEGEVTIYLLNDMVVTAYFEDGIAVSDYIYTDSEGIEHIVILENGKGIIVD